jgi:hypothetical protein
MVKASHRAALAAPERCEVAAILPPQQWNALVPLAP